VALALWATTAVAQVAPTSVFQLNGNAASQPLNNCTYGGQSGQLCDYWNLLNGVGDNSTTGGPVPGSQPGGSLVRTYISGTASTLSYTGGGSKDPNPLSQWAYSSGPTPNKDTFNAGYAAAYVQNGHLIVVFGADRVSPNGDANIGIWFFQQNVSLNGTGGFTGAHVNGDVFVVSAFTGGGGTSGVSVYVWNSNCAKAANNNPQPGQCAASNLELLASAAANSVCGSSAYCAITNSSTTTATWASYSGGTLASPLFFEGGVDITFAFQSQGLATPCFASFLEETRSSQSPSAVLKDFLLGQFPICSIGTTKSCTQAAPNTAGTAFNYTVGGVVTNTGVGTLYDVFVTDSIGAPINSSNAIPVVNNTLNSPNINTHILGAGETGTWSESYSSTSQSVSDTAIATGYADQAHTASISSSGVPATCATNASTVLSITKSCKASLQATGGAVSAVVSYGGTVCNAGSSQVTGITLRDYPNSTNQSGAGTDVESGITLGPGTSQNPTCVNYGPFTYSPTLIDQTITGADGIAGDGPGRYFFSDLIVIKSATSTLSPQPIPTSSPDARVNGTFGNFTASCPICQGASECAP
jgi:hypothetical protein